ncbi:hypothetical protein [Kitasatospora sp. NPDC051914]|uniref:hypothetical protein n=1 Tax=Kitasatospora sp. NPDC051914 TaxID=3154945 RepID=UPI003417B6E9
MDEEPMGRGNPAEASRAAEEQGGEPACLLAMLCPSCDAVLEARRPERCPRCGADLNE